MKKDKGVNTPNNLPKEERQESRTWTIIATVLSVLFLLFAMVITVTVFTSRATGYPKLFGYSFLSVQTDSMEPTLNVGDLIIDRATDEDMRLNCKVGDIITFTMVEPNTQETIINTHRIIEVEPQPNGNVYYITQGDRNKTIDETMTERVFYSYVLGVYTGKKLDGVGKVIDFLRQPMGFGLCVLLQRRHASGHGQQDDGHHKQQDAACPDHQVGRQRAVLHQERQNVGEEDGHGESKGEGIEQGLNPRRAHQLHDMAGVEPVAVAQHSLDAA